MRLKAGLLLVGCALTLAAHQILPFSLIHSEPAAGSVFADAPPRIRLIFGDKVDPSTARISLTDSTGQTITLAPKIDPHLVDGIIAAVPPLKSGVYSVAWRVSSFRAEAVSGSYKFAFGPHASLPPVPDTLNQGDAGLEVSPRAQHAAELALSLVLVGLLWLQYRSRGAPRA